MSEEEKLQLLLSKTEVIRLWQEQVVLGESFNIFRILRAGHEEVGLHSRFLFELLNPNGTHGLGDKFLRLFVSVCNKDDNNIPAFSYDNVQVFRERAHIDILIQDNNQAVVIENKIYASDQYEQLKRYFEYAANTHRRPTLLYLTLHGDEPAQHSVGNLVVKPVLISYKKEINEWLTLCIQEASLQPMLRETLAQYLNLINQLTGANMSALGERQFVNLMAQGDNAEQASVIVNNWNHVRWYTEMDFWNELLALAAIAYKVLDENKFSDEAISMIVHESRNTNPWYGISFIIGILQGNEVKFRIERNNGPAYYGIRFTTPDVDVRKRMIAALETPETRPSPHWASHKTTRVGINLHDFSNPITLQMVNSDKRQLIMASLWKEVQAFIAEAINLLQREFGSDFTPVNLAVSNDIQ
ncbi:MAG: PD-(D/E)XK nuclease family protein [Janthinobacterium lividum]